MLPQSELFIGPEPIGPNTPDLARLRAEGATGRADWFDRGIDELRQPRSAAAVVRYPFQPTISGTTVTVRNGTLNNVAPTNISSSFYYPGGTYYLVLTCYSSSGVITSSALSIDGSAPSAISSSLGFPPTSFGILLYVLTGGAAIRVIGTGSLQAVASESLRVQKTITTPDMLPYDSYYTWQITNV